MWLKKQKKLSDRFCKIIYKLVKLSALIPRLASKHPIWKEKLLGAGQINSFRGGILQSISGKILQSISGKIL